MKPAVASDAWPFANAWDLSMIRVIRAEERERPNARHGQLWRQRLGVPLRRGGRGRSSPPVVTLDEVMLASGVPEPEAEPDAAECITYVCEGALDGPAPMPKMLAGDFQYRPRLSTASAPFALTHAGPRGARLFRLWLDAEPLAEAPGAEVRRVGHAPRRDRLCLIASRGGARDSLRLRQDVSLFSASLDQGTHVSHALGTGRFAWIYVLDGALLLNNIKLHDGDAVSVDEMIGISLLAASPVEFLLVDMTAGRD